MAPQAAPVRVLCVGEAMLELSEAGDAEDGAPLARIGVAGDTLNCAIYLARTAGAAAQVGYATALGEDPHSDRMLGFIAAEGVGTDLIRRLPGRLGRRYQYCRRDRRGGFPATVGERRLRVDTDALGRASHRNDART